MTSRPALAALIGAMDVPPGEAMSLLTDYRAEVARELGEEIRAEARDCCDERCGSLNAAALIDPEGDQS